MEEVSSVVDDNDEWSTMGWRMSTAEGVQQSTANAKTIPKNEVGGAGCLSSHTQDQAATSPLSALTRIQLVGLGTFLSAPASNLDPVAL